MVYFLKLINCPNQLIINKYYEIDDVNRVLWSPCVGYVKAKQTHCG